jgi:hypothetical protein
MCATQGTQGKSGLSKYWYQYCKRFIYTRDCGFAISLSNEILK